MEYGIAMLAIIPARGGSKGLPGKNVRPLGGMPLICHSIKAALAASTISRVIVSTDDDEIASISKNCGAEVPFIRPTNLAGDNSMVMDAYLHVVDKITDDTKKPVESFVALLPTAPLRLPKDIDGAVDIFKMNKADSVISVTESSVPVQWYRRITNEGILSDYLPEFNAVVNRQELEQTYVPNGAIYVFRTEVLRATRQYYMKKTYPYIMPHERSVDIDVLLDFEWAAFCLERSG
ncbi:MAG: acylneuraminate cytidylyltransferase family protein [Sedimenticola sp.]